MDKDKIIKADQGHHTLKLFNLGSILGLVFIILTAGFMVFQNMKVNEELNDAEVIATAFAEQIQTICINPEIQRDYERMCSIASSYADEEHYLGATKGFSSPEDIDEITCSAGTAIIHYKDGSEAVADVECKTEDG